MKKAVLLSLISIIAFSMGACGQSSQGTGEGTTGSQSESSASASVSGSEDSESAASSVVTDQADSAITAYVGTNIFNSSMDPVKGFMSYGYDFINNALIRVNPESEYTADLATDWTVSDDALTYTYHLRDDVRFSDGSEFTSEDVKFTYEEVMNNQANNENVDLTRLDSVETPDDYTVVFHLKEPYSPFLDTTAMLQIVPSDSYDSDSFDTKPVGTGAWKVVEYGANQQIILEANEDYFEGAPQIKRVTLVYMDQDAAYAAASSGQLDVVMVSPNYADEKIDGMTLQSFETMDVRQISLPMNPSGTGEKDGETVETGNDVTSDPAVREALAVGIDRQTIINNALNGVGVPAETFTDNLVWANTQEYQDNQTDEAEKIMEDGGWTMGDDGIYQKDGLRCSFDLIAPGGDEDRYALAEALADNAKNLGIEINVKTASWDEIMTLQYTTPVVWGWGQFSPTVIQSLFSSDLYLHGAYDNPAGYSNEKVDQDIENALSANNQEDAINYWKDAQNIADADHPYLYIVNIRHCYFVKDNLDLSPETQIPHPHGHGSPVICNMKDWKLK